MAQLQEKHQQWGGEGMGAGGRHLRFKNPGCVWKSPVRSGPTVAGLMLPGLARGTGALAWPPAAHQPASLQRSWHLSRGSLASGSCSWSPRAPGPPFMDRPVAVGAGAVMTPRSFPSTAGVSCSLPSGCGEGVHPQLSRGQGGEQAFSL